MRNTLRAANQKHSALEDTIKYPACKFIAIALAAALPIALHASTLTLTISSSQPGSTPLTLTDSGGVSIAFSGLQYGGFLISVDAAGAPELGGLELLDFNSAVKNQTSSTATITMSLTESGIANVYSAFGLNHEVGGTNTGSGAFDAWMNGIQFDSMHFSANPLRHAFSGGDETFFANSGDNVGGFSLTEFVTLVLGGHGVASFDAEQWDPPSSSVPEPSALSIFGLGALISGASLRKWFGKR